MTGSEFNGHKLYQKYQSFLQDSLRLRTLDRMEGYVFRSSQVAFSRLNRLSSPTCHSLNRRAETGNI